jgi:rhamnose utilization protein RhaD (predicted bifunctional aldolase and dehydrogenase)
MSIQALVEISRYYGSNPDYVLAGGGNTSFKDDNTLYIKGSGTSLAEAAPESFVKMDRKALSRIWEKAYPASSAERESAVLADMMAARMSGEEQKRPSVETLLHDMLPFAFVVHLHPALVNGLTCSQRGEAAMQEIFGDDAIWIPSVNPGYILSQRVLDAMDAYRVKRGKDAAVIFLQNHGVFVGADSIEEIRRIYDEIMAKIGAKTVKQPDFSREIRDTAKAADNSPAGEMARTLAELAGTCLTSSGEAAFLCNNEIAALVKDRASFAPVSSAFTPDHIVYAGSHPLFTEASNAAGLALQVQSLREDWNAHTEKTGRKAKLVAVQGLGVFGVGTTEKAALLAVELFKDSVKIAVYAGSFDGPRFMSDDQIDFIDNWEVERFRSSVSAK